jgi:hypothetical protein
LLIDAVNQRDLDFLMTTLASAHGAEWLDAGTSPAL